jgi:predicted metal-binding protein
MKAGRCRFPYQARPSMEAIGIDVFDLIKKAGWEAYAQFGDLSRVPTAITVGILFVV